MKKNWPVLHAEVEAFFDAPPPDRAFDVHTETDKNGGGRLETRRHTVCHMVDWITSDRRYPGEPVFPDLAMIGRIETEVERHGTVERQTRYYLCSAWLDAKTFARAACPLGHRKPPPLGSRRGVS